MTDPATISTETMTPCGECGMPVLPGEYHPFAACLMFKQCHNSETVEANLAAVLERGRDNALSPGASDELAFQVLEMYGVPRTRAKTVHNGIMVLAERIRKSEQSPEPSDKAGEHDLGFWVKELRGCANDLRPGCAFYSGLSMCIRLDIIADALAARVSPEPAGGQPPAFYRLHRKGDVYDAVFYPASEWDLVLVTQSPTKDDKR